MIKERKKLFHHYQSVDIFLGYITNDWIAPEQWSVSHRNAGRLGPEYAPVTVKRGEMVIKQKKIRCNLFMYKCFMATMLASLLTPFQGCSNGPRALFSDGFIEHLRSNASNNKYDPNCIESAVRAQWSNERSIYFDANKIRAVRGETDAVNHAIKVVSSSCSEKPRR